MGFALAERIAGIITPVLAIVLLGYLYGRWRKPDMTVANRVNVEIFTPALIFSALASRDFSLEENRWLLLVSALIVLGSGLLAWPVSRLMGFSSRTFVPPMMFNNCGNMGLPLAVLAYGQAGLAPMVAMFAISNAIHFTLGARIVSRDASIRELLLTPMNLATLAGFAFAASDLPRPEVLMITLRLIGDAMIPLMLLALGVRMISVQLSSWPVSVVGALVCPIAGLAVAALIDPWLPLSAEQRGLMYIFASLPPAVLNFIIAEHYRQEPEKVASIVLVGNVASILFVPVALTIAFA